MLKITEDSLNKKLIEASETMPDKVALKAYRNKMQGYKLWKEDSFSRVRVKPGNAAGLVTLCLAKESVSASMQKRNLCSFFFYQLISSFFHFLISSISSPCFTSRQSNCAFRTASSSPLSNSLSAALFVFPSSFWSLFLEADFHSTFGSRFLDFVVPLGLEIGPEKIELRKRCISLISRKDVTPTKGHTMCSEHFPGGQKTYMKNLPIIVAKTTRPTISKQRSTTKSRNRDPHVRSMEVSFLKR